MNTRPKRTSARLPAGPAGRVRRTGGDAVGKKAAGKTVRTTVAGEDVPVRRSAGKIIVSESDWERVVARLEAAEDAADLAEVERRREDARFVPGDVAFAIADGAAPLRAWREHRGLSQKNLAAAVGLSQGAIHQYETGRTEPSLSALRRLAKGLGCAVADLIKEEAA